MKIAMIIAAMLMASAASAGPRLQTGSGFMCRSSDAVGVVLEASPRKMQGVAQTLWSTRECWYGKIKYQFRATRGRVDDVYDGDYSLVDEIVVHKAFIPRKGWINVEPAIRFMFRVVKTG